MPNSAMHGAEWGTAVASREVSGTPGNRRHDAFAAARRPSVPNRLPEICSPGVPSRIPEMPNSPGLQHKGRRVRTQRRPAVHHERAQLKAEFHAAVQALRLLDQTENGAGSKQSNSPQRAPVFGPIKPARRDTSSQWSYRPPVREDLQTSLFSVAKEFRKPSDSSTAYREAVFKQWNLYKDAAQSPERVK